MKNANFLFAIDLAAAPRAVEWWHPSKSNKLRFFNICFAPESLPAFSFVCMALGYDERAAHSSSAGS
jgi:hypothetical protein